MKTVDAAVVTNLRQGYNVYAKPRLTVEWNLNRYFPVTADNAAPETDFGYDPELFPIESIYQPNRPTKGVAKARVGEAIAANSDPLKQNVRFYLIDSGDIYKYWTSPVPTNGSGTFPVYNAAFIAGYEEATGTPDGITVVRPSITYSQVVTANKIIIKTENSWATPNSYSVWVQTTVGGAWTDTGISTGLDNATGQLTIYWNGTAWSTTKPTGALVRTNIAGVQFRVNSLTSGRDLTGAVTPGTTGNNSYFNLIEIAACLEADMTNKLISVSDTFDVAEKSLVYPIGTVTANVASVTLSNLYTEAEYGISASTTTKIGLFNNENTNSPFKGLAEQNAIFNLEYIYTVGTTDYPVQQFKMYAGPFGGGESDEVSIPLRDYTKFFDEEKPRAVFWRDLSVAEILWRLCDQLGFVDYTVDISSTDESPIVPYFWTDGDKTMMEIMNELAMATQTAIYFDSWGRMRVRSRGHMYNESAATAWTLRGTNSGAELSDIISLDVSDEAQSNHVTVRYYGSNITQWNKEFPSLTTVWEPDETMGVTAAILQKSLNNSSQWLEISKTDAPLWRYTGIAQIQGELIRWNGKEYNWYDSAGAMQTALVMSHEELEKLRNDSSTTHRWKNHFTGRLKITERGVWNSEQKDHNVNGENYSVRKSINSNASNSAANGFTIKPGTSTARLTSDGAMKNDNDLLIATRGSNTDTTFYHYGTRLRFKSSSRATQRAGIVFNNSGSAETGYYVELQESRKVDGKKRKSLVFYNRTSLTNEKLIGGANNMGKAVTVIDDRWYDIDIQFTVKGNGDHRVQIALNGNWVMDIDVTSNKATPGGRFGMFARGDTDVEFEYLYAVRKPPFTTLDDSSFYDYINGGFTSGLWEANWVFDWIRTPKRKRKSTKRDKIRKNKRYMDEFGPWVHEVREWDVKFDPAPVLHTKFMLSNPMAVCTEYNNGPFGAKFVIANLHRGNVTIHGDERDNRRVIMIFGRVVEVKDAQEIVKKNDEQIRIKGKIETQIDSTWIQSEKAAEDIADWINNHWSTGADELSVEIFGNTLFELGDILAVDYPDRFMAAGTHRYFVLGIDTTFDRGISTSLTLRRVT